MEDSANNDGALWEREHAIAAVDETLARAREGRGGSLILAGDAGTGKTTLLRKAMRNAGASAFDVGVGRGEEMETGIAWGLLEQVVSAIAASQGEAALIADSALEPSMPYLRMLRLLQGRRGRPLLLALDDLHWTDADSLNVLLFLARRLAELPVALIATMRPWPPAAHDACRALVDGGNGRLLALAPLSPAASGALLAARTAATVPDAEVVRAWDLCRGNPLLIEQYAAGLRVPRRADEMGTGSGTGAPDETDSGDATDPVARSPEMARNLLVARFAGLDEPSMRLLRCASIVGTRFRPEVAVALAELDPGAADEAVVALHRSGLVADDDDGRVRFAHPLFAQALYDETPAPLRRRLHARAFEQLARHGRCEEAAEHAIRAGASVGAEAAVLLEQVGRAASRRGAVVSAARTLEAAAELLGDHAAPGLLLALADALCASGQVPAAADACERVLAAPAAADARERVLPVPAAADAHERAQTVPSAGWEDRVAALVLLGRCQYLAGSADHGETVLEQAVALAEHNEPVRAVLPLLDQAVSAWMAAGPARALPLAARARTLARDAEPELREATEAIWGHLASECGDPGGIAATEPVERRLRSGGGASLAPAELITPRASIYPFAHCAQYAERFDASLWALQLAREQIERAGAANALAVVSLFTGNHLIRRGRLREALAEADRAERFSDLTPLLVPYAAMVRAQALLWSGRVEESVAECERAQTAGERQWMVALWLAHARGLRLLWAGDPAASDALLEAERVSETAGIGEPNHVQWAGHAIAAHLLADREADAVRVLERLERRAAILPSRWPRFAAALGRARLAAHADDTSAALAGYERSLVLLGDVDLPLQRVEALLVWGGLLRRTGGQREARPHLAEALRIAEAHAAGALSAMAAVELRLAGGRRRRQAEHDRDRLTPAELRVARVAASGLANAEVARSLHLSVHTVETHLKRVYAKLGVRGRRQLVGVDLDDPVPRR